jgi:DNA-binding NtrC family response regulator
MLVTHFCEIICSEQGIQPKAFDKDGIESLKTRSWTGNIRELRNVVERLIILGGTTISKEDVEMFA